MTTSWLFFIPIICGMVGGIVGGHYYNKYNNRKSGK